MKIKDQAKAFQLAAERCMASKVNNDGSIQMLVIPGIVNLVFAAELYMKHILNENGNKGYGHPLIDLFKELHEEQINEVINNSGYVKEQFYEMLEAHSTAFVKWRYIYEQDSANINYGFLLKLANALEKVANKN
jgi:hypothetical protein